MQSTDTGNSDSPQAPDRRAVGFPRQYGIRTMLIITAIYGVLFAFLASLEAPPALFVLPAVFLGGVALAQMFLFQGRRPREASLLAGSCLFFAAAAVAVAICHLVGESGDGSLLWAAVLAPAVGAALGYLVGVAIAGPFLVAKRLRHRRAAGRQAPDGQRDVSEP